jgi:hypothetical protein
MNLEAQTNLHIEKAFSDINNLRGEAAKKMLDNTAHSPEVKDRLEKIVSSAKSCS